MIFQCLTLTSFIIPNKKGTAASRTFLYSKCFSAKAVGAVGAAQRTVGSLPETFGVEVKAKLPDQQYNERANKKGKSKEAGNKHKGRKHHEVIPVENTAGGAAAVFHKDDAEGAPEQYADQVTKIKHGRDQKKNGGRK